MLLEVYTNFSKQYKNVDFDKILKDSRKKRNKRKLDKINAFADIN